jgi:hypothetical protein
MKRGVLALILGLTLLCMGPPVHADSTIIVGNPDWYEFGFGLAGTFAYAGTGTVPSSGGNSIYAGDPAWTFTASTGVRVTVVDAFVAGDYFYLYDNSTLIGSTAPATNRLLKNQPKLRWFPLSVDLWDHDRQT